MEEKRPGQQPLSDRKADERTQSATARRGAEAPHDQQSDEAERQLIRDAAERAKPENERMKRAGFGDHKGTEGF